MKFKESPEALNPYNDEDGFDVIPTDEEKAEHREAMISSRLFDRYEAGEISLVETIGRERARKMLEVMTPEDAAVVLKAIEEITDEQITTARAAAEKEVDEQLADED